MTSTLMTTALAGAGAAPRRARGARELLQGREVLQGEAGEQFHVRKNARRASTHARMCVLSERLCSIRRLHEAGQRCGERRLGWWLQCSCGLA